MDQGKGGGEEDEGEEEGEEEEGEGNGSGVEALLCCWEVEEGRRRQTRTRNTQFPKETEAMPLKVGGSGRKHERRRGRKEGEIGGGEGARGNILK